MMESLELRPFENSDWHTLAPWFDDEVGAAFMGGRKWIEFAARKAMCEPDAHSLFVGCVGGEAVSVISFSRNPGEDRALVALGVAPHARRRGVGGATIEAICAAYGDIAEFAAYLDPENTASLRMLERLGWVDAPSDVRGRVVRAWRRDGAALPDAWTPPKIR